jgi:hypothetical protein
MKRIVINTSYERFCVSHKAFLRLRELGQLEALREVDPGMYWPEAATPREPSLNQCGALIPRDDEKLVRVVEELRGQWTLCPIKSRFYSGRSEMEDRQYRWGGACE